MVSHRNRDPLLERGRFSGGWQWAGWHSSTGPFLWPSAGVAAAVVVVVCSIYMCS